MLQKSVDSAHSVDRDLFHECLFRILLNGKRFGLLALMLGVRHGIPPQCPHHQYRSDYSDELSMKRIDGRCTVESTHPG